jgi:hypothetical protein
MGGPGGPHAAGVVTADLDHPALLGRVVGRLFMPAGIWDTGPRVLSRRVAPESARGGRSRPVYSVFVIPRHSQSDPVPRSLRTPPWFNAGEFEPANHAPDRGVGMDLDDAVDVACVSAYASGRRCSDAALDAPVNGSVLGL